MLREAGRDQAARAVLKKALEAAREMGSAWIARDIEAELL